MRVISARGPNAPPQIGHIPVELARLRLRGVYLIIAGALLLVAAPLYQSLTTGSDYTAAITAIGRSRDFIPYLAWLGPNLGVDRVLRTIQALPLLLALTLPGPLSRWLWPSSRRARMTALAAGWIGFGVFVLAGLYGLISSGAAAEAFSSATGAAARAAVASSFAQQYAVQSLVSRGLGGVALAVFLGMVSLRFIRATRLPRWAAYLGGLVAALEAANAVVFLLNPLNVQAPTASLTLAALAVWLLVIGIALWQTTPAAVSAPSEASGATTVSDDTASTPPDATA